jgi:general secretion pathway protein G
MHRHLRRCPDVPPGWTLIELLLVVSIIGTLVTIVLPSIQQMIERARVAKAIGDIEALQIELATFQADGDSLPPTLAAIGRDSYTDPWGRPYQYLKLAGTPKGKGGSSGTARKDHFLVPLNSDYDLYSMGKDGATQAPLTAKVSQDDVVRANDGGFIGLAARY